MVRVPAGASTIPITKRWTPRAGSTLDVATCSAPEAAVCWRENLGGPFKKAADGSPVRFADVANESSACPKRRCL